MEVTINGIHITIMKYSNKGIIILVDDNKKFYRIIITLVNELKITITED
jgi:hypothetical protein